jgi:hypothetical protein
MRAPDRVQWPALLIILASWPGLSVAQTEVSGAIEADVSWNVASSPYEVVGDVIVRNDATLTIEPGVQIRFSPGTKLSVGTGSLGGGTLVADGEQGNPISFTSRQGSPSPGDWVGISFLPSAVPAVFAGETYVSGSLLRHCVVEYAQTAVNLRAAAGLVGCTVRSCNGDLGAVFVSVEADTTRLLDCVIEQNTSAFGGGLYCLSPFVLSRARVQDNVGATGGIVAADGVISGSEIVRNTATANGYAGGLTIDGGATKLRCSSITSNTGVLAGGIAFASWSTVSALDMQFCNVHSNAGYDVHNGRSESVDVGYNWWGSTDPTAIGLEIYDCLESQFSGCVTLSPVLSGSVSLISCVVPVQPMSWGRLKAAHAR